MAKSPKQEETAGGSDPRLLAFSRKPHRVDIEGVEPLFLKRFSGIDRISFIEAVKDLDSSKITHLIVALTACTPEGKRLFRDDEVEVVAEMDSDILDRLGVEALKINGLSQGAADAATKSAK